MSNRPPAPIRLCTALVRAGAVLAPGDVRRDWLREWEAEIWFAVTRRRPRQAACSFSDGTRSTCGKEASMRQLWLVCLVCLSAEAALAESGEGHQREQ